MFCNLFTDSELDKLRDENDSLKCQLEAYTNEVAILKQQNQDENTEELRQNEAHKKDEQIRILQQTLKGMQQVGWSTVDDVNDAVMFDFCRLATVGIEEIAAREGNWVEFEAEGVETWKRRVEDELHQWTSRENGLEKLLRPEPPCNSYFSFSVVPL